jgi:hypothetical protein
MSARHSAPPAISARHSAPPAMSARHSAPPALTSTPNEYSPSWPEDWREQTNGGRRERVRERDDRWEREELPRPVSGPRGRRVDFDATDHRWR